MLKNSIHYTFELEKFFTDFSNREYLKYYIGENYYDFYIPPDKELYGIDLVSVYNEKISCRLRAEIDGISNIVTNISIVSIDKSPISVIRSLIEFLDELFLYRKFYKIEFFSYSGGPGEKLYDKIVRKYCGRKVGIKTGSAILIDGSRVDESIYEILREDYLKICGAGL